jgi:hypothetical protein
VVPAEDHRDGSRREDLAHGSADRGVALLRVGRDDLGVAVVDHRQRVEWLDPQVQVMAVHGPALVGQPNGPGPEPGSRAPRGGLVERRPDDGHVGAGQVLGVKDQVDLAERAPRTGVGRLGVPVDPHGQRYSPVFGSVRSLATA